MKAQQCLIQEPIVGKLNYSDAQNIKIYNQNYQRPPPFCFCLNPQTKSIMPISKLYYQVNVNLGLITVSMFQTYENNLEGHTNLEYVFLTRNSAAFIKLEVEFGDQKLIGLVKEKQEASREYAKGIQEEKTLLYSYKDDRFPDIMRVKLGNLAPKSKLIVNYQLQLMNFGELNQKKVVYPSYFIEPQNVEAFKLLEQFIDLGSFKYNFLQDIEITFNLPTPITFCQSQTHKILRKDQGKLDNKNDLIFLDPNYQENFLADKRFILLFSNTEIHQPIINLSYFDNDELKQEQYCATIPFIPQFNLLKLDDAYQAYLEQYDLDAQEFQCQAKGEYIFLLDRSKSMRKKRIRKAKKALCLFIRSLPEDSYFNVISFGGIYEQLWSVSQKYSICSASEALEKIQDMEADLRGTQLLEPLQWIYEQQRQDGYRLNIFILTDGKVTPYPVIDLVKENLKSDIKVKVAVDVLQKMLLQLVMVKFHFTYENKDLNQKVINLLQDSMTPQLENFELVHKLKNPYCIVPNPQSVKCLKKNIQFTILILFPRQDKNQLDFVLKYYDPQIKEQCQFNVYILQSDAIKQEQYHKFAAFKGIQILEEAYLQQVEYVENLLISKEDIYIEDIVGISLTHQVLSRETAFLCEIAGPDNNLKEKLKQKVIEYNKVQSNQIKKYESKKREINWSDIDSQKYRQKQQIYKLFQDEQINNEFNDETQINLPVYIKKRSEQRYQKEQQYKKEQEQLIRQKELEKIVIQDFQDQNQDFKIENHNKKEQMNQNQMKISVLKILKYAQIDGQFDSKILNLFQFQQFKMPNGLTEHQWVNTFAINYMQLKCSKEKGIWQLIVQKTKGYLKRNGVQYQFIYLFIYLKKDSVQHMQSINFINTKQRFQ